MRTSLSILLLSAGLASCSREPGAAGATPPKFTPEETAQSLALLFREAEKGKVRFAALDAVRNSAPYVSEFFLLFPGAEVNYRYFAMPDEPGLDVAVDLHERYELTLQLPVHFDPERRKVIGYGEPHFLISEVQSVSTNTSGIAETTYNPDGERHFGSNEWHTLVERHGDFSAIGYALRTNQPVAGFKNRNARP